MLYVVYSTLESEISPAYTKFRLKMEIETYKSKCTLTRMYVGWDKIEEIILIYGCVVEKT